MRDADEPESETRGLDRRDLLARAAVVGAAAATFWFTGLGNPLRRGWIRPTEAGEPHRSLTEAQWKTLEAAFDRLLPSGGADDPGARDVNAIGYVDALFATEEIDADARRRVLEGAAALDREASGRGADSFSALQAAEADAVLRAREATPDGRRWLEDAVPLVLEAFLGDPVHGGNVGEAGWRWARHVPGFPRPPGPG